jgi:hypothetical protein
MNALTQCALVTIACIGTGLFAVVAVTLGLP